MSQNFSGLFVSHGRTKRGMKMWSNRKARFTIILAILVAANVALWLCSSLFGLTLKGNGGLFIFIYMIDFFVFLGFAFLGVLAAWLSAFRPELLIRSLERSIAKRNSN